MPELAGESGAEMRGPADKVSGNLIGFHPREGLAGRGRNKSNVYVNFAETRLRSAACAPVLDSVHVDDGEGR